MKKPKIEIDEEVLEKLPPEVAQQIKGAIERMMPVMMKLEEAKDAVRYLKDNTHVLRERHIAPPLEVMRAACLLAAGPETITMFHRGDEEKSRAEMMEIAQVLIDFVADVKSGRNPSQEEEGTLGETVSFAGKRLF